MRKSFLVFAAVALATLPIFANGQEEESSTKGENNLTEPGTLPIVKESITLDFFATPGESYIIEDNEWFDFIKEETNINVNFETVISNNAQEKINLLLVSQTDLPDVFMTYGAISSEQLGIYGDQGLFVNVKDYMDKLPNLAAIEKNDPELIKSVTSPSGNLYSFITTNICTHCLFSQRAYINQAWLDNLGLDTPETLEDLYEVFVAFKENDANGNGDPNDEIPMAALSQGWRTDLLGYIMNPFTPVANPADGFLYLRDGEIVSSIYQPGFKDGLKFIAKLYEEGLLDVEAFTMNPSQMRTLTEDEDGNRVGFIQSGALGPFVTLSKDGARNDFQALEPVAGPGGRQTPYWKPYPSNRYVVTSTCENIEAALRLADFMMVDPFDGNEEHLIRVLNNRYGPNGWKDAQGKTALFGDTAYYEWTFVFGEPTNLNIGNLPPVFQSRDLKSIQYSDAAASGFSQEAYLAEAAGRYEPYGLDITIPPVVIAAEEAAEYADTTKVALDYIKQETAAFIIGDKDVDADWDKFIDELDALGFNRLIEIKQNAYDARYK